MVKIFPMFVSILSVVALLLIIFGEYEANPIAWVFNTAMWSGMYAFSEELR